MIGPTPEEDLAFIKKMMQDSNRIIVDDGVMFIVWGILVMAAYAFEYAVQMVFGSLNAASISKGAVVGFGWTFFIGTGWLYTVFRIIKAKRRGRVRTFAGRILGDLWGGCGIALAVIGFVGAGTGALNSFLVCGVVATVLGIAYFSMSAIFEKQWMKLLALGWWTGAAIIFLNPGLHVYPLIIAMLGALLVLPGLMLHRRYRQDPENIWYDPV